MKSLIALSIVVCASIVVALPYDYTHHEKSNEDALPIVDYENLRVLPADFPVLYSDDVPVRSRDAVENDADNEVHGSFDENHKRHAANEDNTETLASHTLESSEDYDRGLVDFLIAKEPIYYNGDDDKEERSKLSNASQSFVLEKNEEYGESSSSNSLNDDQQPRTLTNEPLGGEEAPIFDVSDPFDTRAARLDVSVNSKSSWNSSVDYEKLGSLTTIVAPSTETLVEERTKAYESVAETTSEGLEHTTEHNEVLIGNNETTTTPKATAKVATIDTPTINTSTESTGIIIASGVSSTSETLIDSNNTSSRETSIVSSTSAPLDASTGTVSSTSASLDESTSTFSSTSSTLLPKSVSLDESSSTFSSTSSTLSLKSVSLDESSSTFSSTSSTLLPKSVSLDESSSTFSSTTRALLPESVSLEQSTTTVSSTSTSLDASSGTVSSTSATLGTSNIVASSTKSASTSVDPSSSASPGSVGAGSSTSVYTESIATVRPITEDVVSSTESIATVIPITEDVVSSSESIADSAPIDATTTATTIESVTLFAESDTRVHDPSLADSDRSSTGLSTTTDSPTMCEINDALCLVRRMCHGMRRDTGSDDDFGLNCDLLSTLLSNLKTNTKIGIAHFEDGNKFYLIAVIVVLKMIIVALGTFVGRRWCRERRGRQPQRRRKEISDDNIIEISDQEMVPLKESARSSRREGGGNDDTDMDRKIYIQPRTHGHRSGATPWRKLVKNRTSIIPE